MSTRFSFHVRFSAILSAMVLVPIVFALRLLSPARADALEAFGCTMVKNLCLNQWEGHIE